MPTHAILVYINGVLYYDEWVSIVQWYRRGSGLPEQPKHSNIVHWHNIKVFIFVYYRGPQRSGTLSLPNGLGEYTSLQNQAI